jgi:hypothetical protein
MQAHKEIRMKIWAALAVILTSLAVEAKVFRNAYVAFELSDNWKCVLEHTEWVCRSEADKESKEAIIILTAKEVGPTDSLTAYNQHLANPTTRNAAGAVGQVKIAPKQVKINDHVWIDALHLGSEVPNYFTRYLATIKDRIAILVTLSAHKDFYTKYSNDFYKSVMSLRVIATNNLLAQAGSAGGGTLRPGSESLGAPIAGAMPADMVGMPGAQGGNGATGSGQKTKTLLISLGVVLAAVAGYVLMKMRK